VPRGHALGMVSMVPHQDEYSITRQQLRAGIDVSMGGRVAEELVFGEDQVPPPPCAPAPPTLSFQKRCVPKRRFCAGGGLWVVGFCLRAPPPPLLSFESAGRGGGSTPVLP